MKTQGEQLNIVLHVYWVLGIWRISAMFCAAGASSVIQWVVVSSLGTLSRYRVGKFI